METNIILGTTIGLPGAGKSTLCKNLDSQLRSKYPSELIYMIHVCYDHLIPLSVQEELALLKQSGQKSLDSNSDWKSVRQEIHIKVDNLLDCLKTGRYDASLSNFINPEMLKDSNSMYIVLLDDNFYYRSMRYEYFQLARKHGVGYCQLYVECSTEIAVQQNTHRVAQKRVANEVVRAMATKLQPPQPRHHVWEHSTCIIYPDNLNDLSKAWEMIDACFKSAVAPLEDRSAEIAESRIQCSRSVAHQADVCLRAIVGHLIKDSRSKNVLGAKETASLSRRINEGRLKVLGALQDGTMGLPPHLAEAVKDENKDEFKDFLQSELQANLQ